GHELLADETTANALVRKLRIEFGKFDADEIARLTVERIAVFGRWSPAAAQQRLVVARDHSAVAAVGIGRLIDGEVLPEIGGDGPAIRRIQLRGDAADLLPLRLLDQSAAALQPGAPDLAQITLLEARQRIPARRLQLAVLRNGLCRDRWWCRLRRFRHRR